MNPSTLRWLVIAILADAAMLIAYLVVAVGHHARRLLRGSKE